MREVLSFLVIIFFSNFTNADSSQNGHVSDGGSLSHMEFMAAAEVILAFLESSDNGKKYALDKKINVKKMRSFLHVDRVISTRKELIDKDGDIVSAKIEKRAFYAGKNGELYPIERIEKWDLENLNLKPIDLDVILYNENSWVKRYQSDDPHWIYPLVFKELIRITNEYRETTIERTSFGILLFFTEKRRRLWTCELYRMSSQFEMATSLIEEYGVEKAYVYYPGDFLAALDFYSLEMLSQFHLSENLPIRLELLRESKLDHLTIKVTLSGKIKGKVIEKDGLISGLKKNHLDIKCKEVMKEFVPFYYIKNFGGENKVIVPAIPGPWDDAAEVNGGNSLCTEGLDGRNTIQPCSLKEKSLL